MAENLYEKFLTAEAAYFKALEEVLAHMGQENLPEAFQQKSYLESIKLFKEMGQHIEDLEVQFTQTIKKERIRRIRSDAIIIFIALSALLSAIAIFWFYFKYFQHLLV